MGELAIDKLASVWTLVAPNERVSIKTHLHDVPKDDGTRVASGTHKVTPGETVSRIARDNGTTYQEICKLNGIEKPYTIYPGQILKLPPKHGKKAPVPPAPYHGQPATHAPVPDRAPRAAAALPGKPAVSEKRDQESRHPVADVVATTPSDRIAAAIAYAMKHKEPKSVHLCLKYVKRALFASKAIRSYPGIIAAKDFGPFLGKEGFDNLLESKPGANLKNAPIGSIIIYRPVEMQAYHGKTIYGHIEIKTEHGYVSDFFTERPTYGTDAVTMVSPVGRRIPVSYKVIGIWFKE
ncbi:LysM peptidoglycan-binding domain-containing protein [Massilia forsythiae]|uniref:LysM peptidoglycan-binding domain-containing protein n=1 Tax=Massilia forsythiae TaxID=2728020 RepID=A0A7Z2VZT5_9BURK|nr:LysM peptidoglycan-binding domain-containing protein [Massilia forsythiae]QJE02483.1 LysM peptidoglycan-binding domain-containing protein [Massilia forsythiae]